MSAGAELVEEGGDDEELGGGSETAQQPPVLKSGAAAAAAIQAARANVRAREEARQNWRDLFAAARQSDALPGGALSTSAASNDIGAAGPDAGKAEPEREGQQGVGTQRVGARTKKTAKGRDWSTEAAPEKSNGLRRKRTRSGIVVECEEI